jgi:hypothetical protein
MEGKFDDHKVKTSHHANEHKAKSVRWHLLQSLLMTAAVERLLQTIGLVAVFCLLAHVACCVQEAKSARMERHSGGCRTKTPVLEIHE